MAKDPMTRMKERELEELHEREIADLEVEANHAPRPLEGLSGALGTNWTPDQDEREARAVHGHDEEKSRHASELQVEQSDPARQHAPQRQD